MEQGLRRERNMMGSRKRIRIISEVRRDLIKRNS